MAGNVFGELFKKLRLTSRQSLREFCIAHGCDPGNISKMERGLAAPPQSESKLREYGIALGLTDGSQQMQEFVDIGMLQSGRIPQDIMLNEELFVKLPVLLRTMNVKLQPDQLDDFIKMIREN